MRLRIDVPNYPPHQSCLAGDKAIASQAWTGLVGSNTFQHVHAPTFQDSRHMKVVSLSALGTDRLYPPGNIPGTYFCSGQNVSRRIMSRRTSKFEPATSRLVAQCLNQLLHPVCLVWDTQRIYTHSVLC